MIFGSIELPLPLDILDALVMKCLPGYVSRGWIDFTREQITPASVVYRFRHNELGDLGEIELYKASDKSSEMSIVRPPRPTSRHPTPEELKAIAAIPGREEWLRAHAALSKKISAENDERHRRAKEHQGRVLRAMFSRFRDDLAWKKAIKDRGRLRGPMVRTQIRAAVFRGLKEEHPEWSQAKVALEACEDLGEAVTADTVRNTYRAMDWTWERADRIR